MNLRYLCTLAAVLLAPLTALYGADGSDDPLLRGFANPPDSAKPFIYWYWMNGAISREGLTADLEAMKRAGIGGAMIFNIGGHVPAGPVKVLSPEWRDLMKHAIRKAGELGIAITLNNSMAGWSSSGGPWITPELAMQRVTWSETAVQGGQAVDAVMPQPPANLGFYRDIAVLAFPTPAVEQAPVPVPVITASDAGFNANAIGADQAEPAARVGGNWDAAGAKPATVAVLNAASGQEAWVQFAYAEPFPARSLHLAFGSGPGHNGRLQASDDGRQWREVQAFEPRNLAPVDPGLCLSQTQIYQKSPERLNGIEVFLTLAKKEGKADDE